MQVPMNANRKRPAVCPHGTGRREDVKVGRDHLQISPRNLGAAMSAFEHDLLSPKGVTRHPPLSPAFELS